MRLERKHISQTKLVNSLATKNEFKDGTIEISSAIGKNQHQAILGEFNH
jgi:hypothetical protein